MMSLDFLLCVRYSRLYRIYHKKHEKLTDNPPVRVTSIEFIID